MRIVEGRFIRGNNILRAGRWCEMTADERQLFAADDDGKWITIGVRKMGRVERM